MKYYNYLYCIVTFSNLSNSEQRPLERSKAASNSCSSLNNENPLSPTFPQANVLLSIAVVVVVICGGPSAGRVVRLDTNYKGPREAEVEGAYFGAISPKQAKKKRY